MSLAYPFVLLLLAFSCKKQAELRVLVTISRSESNARLSYISTEFGLCISSLPDQIKDKIYGRSFITIEWIIVLRLQDIPDLRR